MNVTIQSVVVSQLNSQMNVAFGVWDIVLNGFIFMVLVRDSSLLQQSAFLFGIAFGNFMQGTFLFSITVYRLSLPDSSLNDITTSYKCAMLIFPLFLPLGLTSQAAFLILAGLERFLAVNAAHWFWNTWRGKRPWQISIFGYAFSLIIVIGGVAWAFNDLPPTTWQCITTSIFGAPYYVVCAMLAAVGGAVSSALTMAALVFGVAKIKKLPLGDASRLRKQLHLTKAMLLVSLCDVALVSIPYLLLVALPNMGMLLQTTVPAATAYYLNSVNSTLNLFAFLTFNKNFRDSAIALLRIGKAKIFVKSFLGQNQVQPLS